jgi:hypothetical protein
MAADLKTFIRRALAAGERIDVGQFRLLNLAAVQERAGENWPSVRKKVFTAATQFLVNRLGADDAVIPCEEGFLVLFAKAPDDPAAVLAALNDALMTFFLGDPETRPLAVESTASRVDADDITNLAQAAKPAPAEAPALRPLPRTRATSECRENEVIAHYRPIWDAQKQAVAFNACLPKVVIGGRALEGRRAISTGMDKASQFELDACALGAAIEMILAMASRQKRIRLRVAIHASCWSDSVQRAELMAILDTLPVPLRKRLLVRIDGLSGQLAAQASALAELAPSGVGLMAEIPFGETGLEIFDGVGVSLFSCSAPSPVNANSEGLLDHDTKALNRMVKAGIALKAASYLHDVRDLLVLKAGMTSGIRFFSGQAVIPDRTSPSPTQPLSIVDICRVHKAA